MSSGLGFLGFEKNLIFSNARPIAWAFSNRFLKYLVGFVGLVFIVV